MHIVTYLAKYKATVLNILMIEGKIALIKAIRINTNTDGEVMNEWLSPPSFDRMVLKEAKELADLLDPSWLPDGR